MGSILRRLPELLPDERSVLRGNSRGTDRAPPSDPTKRIPMPKARPSTPPRRSPPPSPPQALRAKVPGPDDDPAVKKAQGTQALAAAFPFNATSRARSARPARRPPAGRHRRACAIPRSAASTLTENANRSAKTRKRSTPCASTPAAACSRPTSARRSRTTRTRSRRGCAGRRCWRTSSSARRSRTSTTSASPSASCTRAAPAAHGFFECYESHGEAHARRRSSSEKGKRTPVFVRFSTVAGERGSTDTRARRARLRDASSTPTRATSTSSATTSRCSSSRTR